MKTSFPLAPFATVWTHRSLILSLTRHGIASRYRASWFGFLWPVLQPFLLIAVFSLVFGYVMPLRWIGDPEGQVGFPLFLYAGLVVFTLFSEVVSQAPNLVVTKVNLVKKVVFPLEILSLVSVFTSLIFFFVNLAVFSLFIAFSPASLSWHLFSALLAVIPFVLFLTGLSWFLSGLSVYVRDVVHIIGIVISAMMFLSPVFYPISSAPEFVQSLMVFNPLAPTIESIRAAVFSDDSVIVQGFWGLWIIGLASFVLGHLWFRRIKAGFADVL